MGEGSATFRRSRPCESVAINYSACRGALASTSPAAYQTCTLVSGFAPGISALIPRSCRSGMSDCCKNVRLTAAKTRINRSRITASRILFFMVCWSCLKARITGNPVWTSYSFSMICSSAKSFR